MEGKSDYDFNLYLNFPMILPNSNFTCWEGFFGQGTNSHRVLVNTPCYPLLTDGLVKSDNEVKKNLSSQMSSFQEYSSLLELLQFINQGFKRKVTDDYFSHWTRDFIKLYRSIEKEINENIGQQNIAFIQKHLESIKLKYTGPSLETHLIKIGLSPNYPNAPLQILEADLPSIVWKNFKQVSRLSDFYCIFRETVDSLTEFWNVIKRLSENSWVIEPENPTRKDVHRRIILNDSLSLVITLNPLLPSAIPDVKFMGSVSSVNIFRSTYQHNLQIFGWNRELDIIENIRRLCQIEDIPLQKECHNVVESDKECIICFSLEKMNELPPSRFCANPKCPSFFHWGCLMEWLTTVSVNSDVFDFLTGPCPYCNEVLSCPKSQSAS